MRDGRDAAVDAVVVPDHAGLGDVAGLGGVDADQDADAFAVFGVLADGDVDAVLVEDGRGVDFARAFGGGIFDRLAVLVLFVFGRIAVEPPDGLQVCLSSPCFSGFASKA